MRFSQTVTSRWSGLCHDRHVGLPTPGAAMSRLTYPEQMPFAAHAGGEALDRRRQWRNARMKLPIDRPGGAAGRARSRR